MTATWFSGVTLTVEVGFASAPSVDVATTSWTDVSAYVRAVSTRRGRNDELGTFSAGTMQVVFSNADRRFDPNYTSSPYSPNVLPMRRIRFKATYSAVEYAVWSGFVDDWPQEYDIGGREATVTVSCTDAFKVLSLLKLPESVYAVQIPLDTPLAWWRLGEQSGTQAVDSSGNGNDGTYLGGATFNTRTGLVAFSTDNAIGFDGVDDGALIPSVLTGFPCTVEGWTSWVSGGTEAPCLYLQLTPIIVGGSNFSVVGTITGTIVAGTVSNATLSSVVVQSSATTSTSFGDGNPHHVVATFADATTPPIIYVDGVAQAVSTTSTGTVTFPTSSTTYIGENIVAGALASVAGTVDEVAIYNSVLSAGTVANHYAYGSTPWQGDTTGARVARFLDLVAWPSADRTIATGISTLQPANLQSAPILQALQEIEASEQGQMFVSGDGKVIFRDRHWRFETTAAITSQATFGDSGSELRYADIVTDGGEQFLTNHVRASRQGGAVIDAIDAASVTKFYERLDDVAGLQNQSDLEVRDLANWRLGTRQNPVLRVVSLEVKPRKFDQASSLFPQVLGRDIGERLTVKRRPQGVGSALTYTVLIEGVDHTVTAEGDWTTRWYLSSSDSQAGMQPLILDDATFGILDTNVLAF